MIKVQYIWQDILKELNLPNVMFSASVQATTACKTDVARYITREELFKAILKG